MKNVSDVFGKTVQTAKIPCGYSISSIACSYEYVTTGFQCAEGHNSGVMVFGK